MTKRARDQQLGTIAVHGGEQSNRRDVDAPVVHPLFQSVNFIQEIGSAEGLRYPRYGNAPNAGGRSDQRSEQDRNSGNAPSTTGQGSQQGGERGNIQKGKQDGGQKGQQVSCSRQ